MGDEDDLAGTAVDHRRGGHGDDLSLASHRHLHLGEHGGLQELARIGQFNPNRYRPGFGIEGGIDIGHAALEDLVRVGIDAHLRHGTRTHLSDVLFEHVGDNPHRRQVGHLVEGVARHEAHALQCFLFGDDAGNRGTEGQRAFGRTGLGQSTDLLLGDVPVPETQQTRFGKLLHAALCLAAGVLQGIDTLGGNGVLALGGDQFRAVDLEQRLALGDRLAGDVHVQAFHVTFELRGNGKAAPLVDLNPTGRAHLLVEDAQFRRLGAHAELLHFLGADPDGVRCCGLVVSFPFVDRDVVHPHRVLLGCRRGVRQAHRVAVVQ